jgi:hypothetical protein
MSWIQAVKSNVSDVYMLCTRSEIVIVIYVMYNQ